MPDTPIPAVPVPTARYYPRLSEIVTVSDLPEFLSFVQDGLNNIFDNIHYKNFQYSKSYRGDSAFYSLDIVSSKKLAIPLPFNLALVLNPDLTGGDQSISSFPITLEYQWEILAFLKTFSSSSFSFSIEDFYKIGLDVFRISEGQVIAHMLNLFVEPAGNITEFEQMLADINEIYGFTGTNEYKKLKMPEGVTQSITILAETVNNHPDIVKSIPLVLFGVYILKSSLSDTKAKLQEFYNIIAPDGIEAHIKRIITPKAKATLVLSAAIEFPRNILKPVKPDGTDFDPARPNLKTLFAFAQAQLYVDTEAGFGYQVELGGSLLPSTFAAIGNTGLLLQIDSLKLDLSKNSNIPEADADGRPNEFVGVYARAISVTLPSKWFHDDTEPVGLTTSTLRLGAYDLLVGTGGLSGTISLETISLSTTGTFNYFNDRFEFIYPLKMYAKNSISNVIEDKVIANYTDLITYLQALNTTNAPYPFQFPLSLKTTTNVTSPLIASTIYTFNNIKDYQSFLSILEGDNKLLWKKIGGENGFRVGFNKFDITFKQNKVIASHIKGALEIKKFVYPENTIVNGVDVSGKQVRVNIEGHIHDNGDFNLTASVNPGFPIKLANILRYDIRTLELGKDDNDFYIGTSGRLSFPEVPVLQKIEAIDISRLRIYSNGSIEIQGGSVMLAEPIIIPLGPVNITVTAIHYGSHQKEVDGKMRKFNYFGFDGGLKVDPLGVEIRGDGIKYYYCVDDLPDRPKGYLHIQTLYLDLTIPASSPAVIINGWLSIPEPGTSPEYQGGIKIKIPSVKISGGADMRLAPKYPAFIIDAEVDLPVPIPIGTFAIYGFRGLIGYRYVAEKEAIGLVSGVNTWYEYYKAPRRGINVQKFNGPNQTKGTGKPFSLGAGASLGTSFDNGTVLNIKAMVLLSMPSLFMIDGRLSIISARLGLDEGGEPPFFAFVAIGDNSLEFGFGADFKMPSKSGEILTINADVGAYFNFKDKSKWYVNFGTREKPITARVLSLITLKSYLMLSAKGIEAGARGEFVFNKTYGPVKVAAWAYVEVGGKISFERPQFGSYIAAGVGAEIDIKILHLYIAIDVLFGAEAVKPMRIYGAFRICVKVKILFIKIKFCGNVELVWDIRKTIDTSPINPLVNADNLASIPEIVKGVNMLTNETFDLAYLAAGAPTDLPDSIKKTIIPLDTYIDIKSEKGLLPGAVANLIGGVNNPPASYVDLVPPERIVKGKVMTQVKHQYAIESISLKAWNGSTWQDYNPYKALYPADTTGVLNSLKIGQWQKSDNQYNTVRLLATTPFSYTEQGEPGWFTPEKYGITAGSLFCEGTKISNKLANFLLKPLNHRYYCYDSNNHYFYSNGVAFVLLNSADDEFGLVSNETNHYAFSQSLSFKDTNILQLVLPEPSVEVILKLTSFNQKVKIKYYALELSENQYQPKYVNPNPNVGLADREKPYEVIKDVTALKSPVNYDHPNWNPVVKIVLEPLNADLVNNQVDNLSELLAVLENNNLNVALTGVGEMQSTLPLEEQIGALECSGGEVINELYKYDSQDNIYTLSGDGSSNTWTNSWDFINDSKILNNKFGFKRINQGFKIESNYAIIRVSVVPFYIDTVLIDDYNGSYNDTSAIIQFKNPDFGLGNDVYNFEITYFKKGNACGPDSQVNISAFINKYVKGTYNYNDSVCIDNFIYYVGERTDRENRKGLITKVNVIGEVIWQKQFRDYFGLGLSFKSVIACENGDIMLVASGGNIYGQNVISGYIVYRVSAQGLISWKKQYLKNDEFEDQFLVSFEQLSGDTYVLSFKTIIYGSAQQGGYSEETLHILKINGSGTVISKKAYTGFRVEKVICTYNKIIIIGNQASSGIVIVLDKYLKFLSKFALKIDLPLQYITFKKAIVKNDFLILSGNITVLTDNGGGSEFKTSLAKGSIDRFDYEYEFITKIDISSNSPKSGSQNLTMISKEALPGSSITQFNANSDGIYLTYNDREFSSKDVIIKFNHNLDVVWTKTFDNSLYIDQVTDTRIIFRWENNSKSVTNITSYAAVANLNLDSCKTSLSINFNTFKPNANFINFNYQVGNSNLIESDVEILKRIEVTDDVAIKEEICPTVVVENVSSSFINRYNKVSHVYNNSIRIGDYIYGVGLISNKSNSSGLITKTDFNGDVVWEKLYSDVNSQGNRFTKVFKSDNTDIIILGSSDDFKESSISRISMEGVLLWKKKYQTVIADHVNSSIQKIVKLAGENYIFLIQDIITLNNSIGTSYSLYEYHLVKINASGDILIKKKLVQEVGNDIIIRDMVASEMNQIVILGSKLDNVYGSIGICIILDNNFNDIGKFGLKSLKEGRGSVFFEFGSFQNGQLFLSGQVLNEADNAYSGFMVKLDLPLNQPNEGDVNIKLIPRFSIPTTNDLFTYQKYDSNVIAKFNSNFDLLWTKEFITTANFNLDQVTDNELIISGTTIENFLGKVNLDLESCRTNDYLPITVEDAVVYFYSNFHYSYEQSNVVSINDNFEVSNVLSTKQEICPTIRIKKTTCDVYKEIKTIFDLHFYLTNTNDYSIYGFYTSQILDILKQEGSLLALPEIQTNYDLLYAFYSNPSANGLTISIKAIKIILSTLDSLGNCSCQCNHGNDVSKNVLFHEVSWLSLEDYEYNINIPSQEAIEADAQATIAGVNQFIQPIWRPDTSYMVQFKLRDLVNNTQTTSYDFNYGFSTAGPVGFFHKNQYSKYGNVQLDASTILNDTTGIVTTTGTPVPNKEPHPDKYPLTSLRQYIDYLRSYPNADGNLINAKPLFYDDDNNTKIDLYFTKAYVTHFFQDWQAYPAIGLPAIKAKMKIIIKDPREDISIVNPPSLDTITESINVPQTTQDWTEDNNPLLPFVIQQWENMIKSLDNCVETRPQVIKPKSKYLSVTLKKLKPLKLYTAIVNGMYDLNKDGALGPIPDPNDATKLIHQEETSEIHKFVFQTSRYKNFREQVNSYKLKDDDGNQQEAIFEIQKSISSQEINALYATVAEASLSGILSEAVVHNLNINYQHPFDRFIEGILALSPINTAISTEFNMVKDTNTNKVIAVVIKNPEPFNNPKIPLENIKDSIQVIKTNNEVDLSYKILHSKDLSQVIIMHDSLTMSENISLLFNYKIWNGIKYEDNSQVVLQNIPINTQN